MIKLIQNEEYVKLVRSINHTEDHKYTVIDKIEQYLFPSDDLLRVWLRLLAFTIPSNGSISLKNNDKINMFNNLYNIHCSIIWIIVNLTWKYSSFGCTVHEYGKYDVYEHLDSSRNVTSHNSNQRLYIEEDEDEDVVMQDETSAVEAGGSSKSDEKRRLSIQEDEENNGQIVSVQDRAQHLDKLGFTRVIKI